jgi:hypothetical protein
MEHRSKGSYSYRYLCRGNQGSEPFCKEVEYHRTLRHKVGTGSSVHSRSFSGSMQRLYELVNFSLWGDFSK